MDRRSFGAMLAMVGAGTQLRAAGTEPELVSLGQNGWMPNNSVLPVLLYRAAFSGADLASAMERTFEHNGWPAQ